MCEVVLVSGSGSERGKGREGEREKGKFLVCVRHSESVDP